MLRAALAGVLEDALLDDAAELHFAVAPEARTRGDLDRRRRRNWLQAELAAPWSKPRCSSTGWCRRTGRASRAFTSAWPTTPIRNFAPWLHWAHPGGVVALRLQGSLAREIVPPPPPEGTRVSATPGAVAAAERWLDAPVQSRLAHRHVRCSGRRLTLGRLRQFDAGAARCRQASVAPGGQACEATWTSDAGCRNCLASRFAMASPRWPATSSSA